MGSEEPQMGLRLNNWFPLLAPMNSLTYSDVIRELLLSKRGGMKKMCTVSAQAVPIHS